MSQVNSSFPDGRSSSLHSGSLSPSPPAPPLPPDPPDHPHLDPVAFPPLSSSKFPSPKSAKKRLQTAFSSRPVVLSIPASSPPISTVVEIKSLLTNFTSSYPLSGTEIPNSKVTIQKGVLDSSPDNSGESVPASKNSSLPIPVPGKGILLTPALAADTITQPTNGTPTRQGSEIDIAGVHLLNSFPAQAVTHITRETSPPPRVSSETWANKMKKSADKPPSNPTSFDPPILPSSLPISSEDTVNPVVILAPALSPLLRPEAPSTSPPTNNRFDILSELESTIPVVSLDPPPTSETITLPTHSKYQVSTQQSQNILQRSDPSTPTTKPFSEPFITTLSPLSSNSLNPPCHSALLPAEDPLLPQGVPPNQSL